MKLLPKASLLGLVVLTGMSSNVPVVKPPAQTVTVNLQQEFQTIHSFGASDCWSAKFIGNWRDETKKTG